MERLPRRKKRPGRPTAPSGTPTREALLEAAASVFATQGIHAPLRAVAQAVGCTPAVIHYHFGDRQALIEELFRLAYDDMEVQLDAALPNLDGDPVETLRAIVREFMAALGRRPFTAHLSMQEIMMASPDGIERLVQKFVHPFAKRLDQVLDRGYAEGRLRQVSQPLMGVTIVGSALYYFIGAEFGRRLYGIDASDPVLVEAFSNQFLDLILHGLTARDAE